MEAKTLEDLSRLECRTCGGEKVPPLHLHPSLAELPPGSFSIAIRDCPDCQENGQPTGLALSELTERCQEDTHGMWCCYQDGRILKSGDSLLVAVERALGRHWEWDCQYHFTGPNYEYIVYRDKDRIDVANADRLAAATEALAKVMEGEHENH